MSALRAPARWHRLGRGWALPAVQIALTLAILANCGFIIVGQYQQSTRPSGLDEAALFSLVEHPLDRDFISAAQGEADLDLLRRLPGVIDATRINCLPLGDAGWRTPAGRVPVPLTGTADTHVALYFGDEHSVGTLGLHLLAGRNFTAEERTPVSRRALGTPRVALVTQALARRLFGDEPVLGRPLYTRVTPMLTIIGVVERLQSAWPGWAFHEDSILLPAQLEDDDAFYLVRTALTTPTALMAQAAQALRAARPPRIVDEPQPFADVRRATYLPQRSVIVNLGVLLAALIAVAAMGTYGVASHRVATRGREIGTRRALGASRGEILRYLLRENLAVSVLGALAGLALAYALNRLLMLVFDVTALPWYCVPVAAAILIVCGQLAVLQPALRAAAVSPARATRGA